MLYQINWRHKQREVHSSLLKPATQSVPSFGMVVCVVSTLEGDLPGRSPLTGLLSVEVGLGGMGKRTSGATEAKTDPQGCRHV